MPGILAYADGEPVAWCSISPRAQHVGLQELGKYRWFDNPDIWTVACFYIRDDFRGRGLMPLLLDAAVAFARERGAKVVEGYPVDEQADVVGSGPGLYMGTASVFSKAGFVEVARGAYNRPVMRYYVRGRI